MSDALFLVPVDNSEVMVRLEELRRVWYPAGTLEDVVANLLVRSEALDAVQYPAGALEDAKDAEGGA